MFSLNACTPIIADLCALKVRLTNTAPPYLHSCDDDLFVKTYENPYLNVLFKHPRE